MKLTREERFKEYIELFTPVQSNLKRSLRAFVQDLNKGLENHASQTIKHPDCSLYLLDSCVPKFLTGEERGIQYAIELSGSYVRTTQYKIEKRNCTLIKEKQFNMREAYRTASHPDGLLDQHTTASMLFDEIAKAFKEIVDASDLNSNHKIGIGFSISFPLEQKSINHGVLKLWTKGFKTGSATHDPVLHQNVVALLENAMARQKINAKVVVAINPVVGALLGGSLEAESAHRPCTVGFIIGSGVNGGYIQRDAEMYGYQSVIINTELGNFDKHLPRTNIDYEVSLYTPGNKNFQIDYYSAAQGRQLLEKMTSELYIGEICRLLLLQLFQHEAPEKAWEQFSLSYENCFTILKDSFLYADTSKIFRLHWNWNIWDEASLGMIHRLVHVVFERSASIAAMAIAGLAMASGCLQPAMGGVTVAIDGNLYTNNIIYQSMVRKYLEIVLDSEFASLISLVAIKDSPAKTAARLVSTLQDS